MGATTHPRLQIPAIAALRRDGLIAGVRVQRHQCLHEVSIVEPVLVDGTRLDVVQRLRRHAAGARQIVDALLQISELIVADDARLVEAGRMGVLFLVIPIGRCHLVRNSRTMLFGDCLEKFRHSLFLQLSLDC